MSRTFPEGVHVFPVRHHSPRSSHALRRFLDALKPALVLIEGPADADALIPLLLEPDTVPPVAILGYRTDGQPASVLYPFATYSPELVAMAWAKEHGVPARFCDMTVGQSLAEQERPEIRTQGDESAEERPPAVEPGDVEGPGDPPAVEEPELALARAHGFRSFEELWEAWFEAPVHDPEEFRHALLAYADVVVARSDRLIHRARDAYMTRMTREAIAAGTPAERIALVVGAAHAAAFAADAVDPALEAHLPAPVPCASTLIPFSFTRLAEQTGYGAGNRAPRYYQRAHDADCSFTRATLEVLVEFSEHLRLRGFSASLADVIEAYRLAVMLAHVRGKSAPGLDEVREATVATMCRGDATHVDGFLWSTVVGRTVGKVGAKVGRNTLQEEFWREVDHRRLPRSDEPESFALKLNDPVQVETSIFLHRLRLAEVPYASYQGATAGAARTPSSEPAGGQAALSRVRENWSAQWTPATDVGLIERIVMGETLQAVATRLLEKSLAEARSTAEAAEVLLEGVVADTPRVVPEALAACDRFAATDEDGASLARACRALSGLVSYGTSRSGAHGGAAAVSALCTRTFTRAVLRLRGACLGDAEAVAPAREAMRILHELALAQPLVDAAAWFTAARELLHDTVIHASCAGMATGLLYLAERLTDEEVALVVTPRLSDTANPQPAADFLSGFFEVNALVLVRNRAVVAALDGFLTGIDPERFRDTLPALRGVFAALGPTERRYLIENLMAVRKLDGSASGAQKVITAKDKAQLEDLGEDLARAMDDLDDLL